VHITDEFGCSDNANITLFPPDCAIDAEIIDSIAQDSTMLPPNDTIATTIDTTTTTPIDTSADTMTTPIDTSAINPPIPASLGLVLEQNYYIPTAFSPNFDGLNDRFTIFANDKVRAINSLKIFDRWGNLVFEQRDFLPNQINGSWDGTFQGQLMDAAVFIFCAEVEMFCLD